VSVDAPFIVQGEETGSDITRKRGRRVAGHGPDERLIRKEVQRTLTPLTKRRSTLSRLLRAERRDRHDWKKSAKFNLTRERDCVR
jgi:hypothetical protein